MPNRLVIGRSLVPTQRQTLSPRLQQAVRLLQLSSLDFSQEIHALQGRNPFLDFDSEEEGDAPPAPEHFGPESDEEPREPMSWLDGLPHSTRQQEDRDTGALDFLPQLSTLADHLHLQLSLKRLAGYERALAAAIIDSLDEDGYLRTPLEDLLPLGSLEYQVPQADWLDALSHVQSLDPAGVGARDLKECLLLQTQAVEPADERQLVQSILCKHLDLLARRQWAVLARQLGCNATDLDAACRRIRQMDPRPGRRYDTSQTLYIVPDILLCKKRGRWSAVLNPSIVPKVRLNKLYADLLQQHCDNLGGTKPADASETALRSHLQEARWTLRNIEERFSTIGSVARVIVERQQQFFNYGSMAMRPMVLKEVAQELGIHESTVSRVTNNKYLAGPSGVFELKYFFSRALPHGEGRSCSPTAVRGLVQQIIDQDRDGKALSDAEIARRLHAAGLAVARRTVTKYRQMLGVEACTLRRRAL